MYGLKKAAILELDNLVHNLTTHGYTPVPDTIGVWHHNTRTTKSCLCGDDFGVKYYTQKRCNTSPSSLKKNYTYTVDWSGQNFCGLKLSWNMKKNMWMYQCRTASEMLSSDLHINSRNHHNIFHINTLE